MVHQVQRHVIGFSPDVGCTATAAGLQVCSINVRSTHVRLGRESTPAGAMR
jgi:hypothetical protein